MSPLTVKITKLTFSTTTVVIRAQICQKNAHVIFFLLSSEMLSCEKKLRLKCSVRNKCSVENAQIEINAQLELLSLRKKCSTENTNIDTLAKNDKM